MDSKFLKSSFVIFVLASFGNAQNQLQVKPCNQKDPQVNVCLKDTFSNLFTYSKNLLEKDPKYKNGDIHIKTMPIDLTNLNVRGSFDDVTLYGAHEAYILAVKSDISKLRFDLKVSIPKFEARGLYNLASKSGLLAFNAGGSFWATFSGVTLIVKLYPRRVAKYKNDETYLELNKVNVDFAVKDMKFKIKEQISKPLEAVYEQILNDQAPMFARELKPTISRAFSDLFKEIFSDIISSIPETQLIEV